MPPQPLDLTLANEIVAGALGLARAGRMPPLAVVVVDLNGEAKAMQREDRASMYALEIARGKAWGCVANKAPGGRLAERARQNPNFMLNLAATAEGKFLPQRGGVLIRTEGGVLLGAVGASGGSGAEDEEVCIQGIKRAGLVPGSDW